jgi:hypothetical protein
MAGILDLLSARKERSNRPVVVWSSNSPKLIPWECIPFVASAVFLTVGTQILEFGVANAVEEIVDGGAKLAAQIVALSYLGAAGSAFFCAFFKIRWEPARGAWSPGSLILSYGTWSMEIGFFSVTVASFACLGIAILLILGYRFESKLPIFATLVASAFFYEIAVLAILDKLGELGAERKQSGIVAATYGYCGYGRSVLDRPKSSNHGRVSFLSRGLPRAWKPRDGAFCGPALEQLDRFVSFHRAMGLLRFARNDSFRASL